MNKQSCAWSNFLPTQKGCDLLGPYTPKDKLYEDIEIALGLPRIEQLSQNEKDDMTEIRRDVVWVSTAVNDLHWIWTAYSP
jgi:hypothetical protein